MGNRANIDIYVPITFIQDTKERNYWLSYLGYRKGEISREEIKKLKDEVFKDRVAHDPYLALELEMFIPSCDFKEINGMKFINISGMAEYFSSTKKCFNREKKDSVPTEWLDLFMPEEFTKTVEIDGEIYPMVSYVSTVGNIIKRFKLKSFKNFITYLELVSWLKQFPKQSMVVLDYSELSFNIEDEKKVDKFYKTNIAANRETLAYFGI